MRDYEQLWKTMSDFQRLWKTMGEYAWEATSDYQRLLYNYRDYEWVPGIVRLQELDYIRDNTLVLRLTSKYINDAIMMERTGYML